jgi:hypothetical protein
VALSASKVTSSSTHNEVEPNLGRVDPPSRAGRRLPLGTRCDYVPPYRHTMTASGTRQESVRRPLVPSSGATGAGEGSVVTGPSRRCSNGARDAGVIGQIRQVRRRAPARAWRRHILPQIGPGVGWCASSEARHFVDVKAIGRFGVTGTGMFGTQVAVAVPTSSLMSLSLIPSRLPSLPPGPPCPGRYPGCPAPDRYTLGQTL